MTAAEVIELVHEWDRLVDERARIASRLVEIERLLGSNAPPRAAATLAEPVALPPAPPPPDVRPDSDGYAQSRRKRGSGSIEKNGHGWRWKFGHRAGPTVSSREEAESLLDAARAVMIAGGEPSVAPKRCRRGERSPSAPPEDPDPACESSCGDAPIEVPAEDGPAPPATARIRLAEGRQRARTIAPKRIRQIELRACGTAKGLLPEDDLPDHRGSPLAEAIG